MGATTNDRKRPHAAEDVDPASFEDRDNGDVKSKKRARTEDRRSLFVRSLPPGATSESLTDFFSQHYPVKHATVVVDQKTKESRGYGFVTLADAEDAVEAKKALDKQDWNGRRIRIDVAEPRQRNNTTGELPAHKLRKEEIQKPNKLIIRNLPWSIKKAEQLEHLFRSFGKVKFADLPQSKGKLKGFGFVTLRGRPNAERALEAINGKEIDGRTLAVDWAVDKETWDKQQQPEEEDKKQKKGNKKQQIEEDEDDQTSSEGSDDEDDEDDNGDDVEGGAEVNRDDQLDADLKNFFKNHMENLEDEDDEDEDEDEDDDDEKDDEIEKEVEALQPKKLMTDNSSTVFVRNLPFTTTDEQLKSFFSHFGKIRYARVVMDKVTEKPAGTGFVCFVDVDEAKSCIKGAPRTQAPVAAAKTSILQDESADPDGKYTLDGRLLSVTQAVNKQEATSLAENSLAKRNEKDKRKLFLLGEGVIDKNSPLFNLLSEPEHRMRQASAAQRRKLVQGNPSLHLSLTRLALRNIPRNMESKDLKELARKAVVGFARDVKAGLRQPLSKEENARDGKDAKEKEHERKAKGKGIIRQAKIVFESGQGQKMQEKDGGKSRGYGFIEYTSHHWALMGLRYLNGLQLENEVGKKQRLVVEFAIENAQVIQRRRANEERSRQLNPEHNKGAKTEAQMKTLAQHTKDNKKRGRKDDRGDRAGKPGRDGKPGKFGKPGRDAPRKQPEQDDGQKTETDAEMKHRLIARTRVMRKKKAMSRGGK